MSHTVRSAFQNLGRGIAATVAGTLAAGLFIAVVEWLGQQIYPPPDGLRPDDVEAIAAHIAQAPAGALLLVLLAWISGVFYGGLLAARIAGRRQRLYSGVIAAVVLVAVIANFSLIPHPGWFVALSVIALPLAAYAAATRAVSVAARSGAQVR